MSERELDQFEGIAETIVVGLEISIGVFGARPTGVANVANELRSMYAAGRIEGLREAVGPHCDIGAIPHSDEYAEGWNHSRQEKRKAIDRRIAELEKAAAEGRGA